MPMLTLLVLTAVAAATPPKPRALTAAEAAAVQKLAGGTYEVNASQSFRVTLSDFGLVDFAIACSSDGLPGCKELLVKDDKVVLSMPDPLVDGNRWDCRPGAVAFRDVDGDRMLDVAIILSCETGAGPTAAQDFPAGEVLFRRGNGFATEPIVDKAIDDQYPKTIKAVLATAKAALRNANASKKSDGQAPDAGPVRNSGKPQPAHP